MIVRIFSDTGCFKPIETTNNENVHYTQQFSTSISDIAERLYGRHKAIRLTNKNNYTHAVILNYAMPEINISAEYVIGFAHVSMRHIPPPIFIAYAQKHIGVYYVGDNNNNTNTALNRPFMQGRTFPLYSPPKCAPFPAITRKIMSICATLKLHTPGQIYRRKLVSYILASNLPIDIYGHGCIEYQSNAYNQGMIVDTRLCGSYPENDPSIMLDTYLFHVTVENYNSESQYTDKLINALVRGTVPVYKGSAAAINMYSDMMISLCGNIKADCALLSDICRDPMRFYRHVNVPQVIKNENLLMHLLTLYSAPPITYPS